MDKLTVHCRDPWRLSQNRWHDHTARRKRMWQSHTSHKQFAKATLYVPDSKEAEKNWKYWFIGFNSCSQNLNKFSGWYKYILLDKCLWKSNYTKNTEITKKKIFQCICVLLSHCHNTDPFLKVGEWTNEWMNEWVHRYESDRGSLAYY